MRMFMAILGSLVVAATAAAPAGADRVTTNGRESHNFIHHECPPPGTPTSTADWRLPGRGW